MSRTLHLCVDIRGVLRWPNRQLKNMITDDSGRKLSAEEAREWLMDRLAEGKKVLPTCDDCEGFSFQTGCPGHENI